MRLIALVAASAALTGCMTAEERQQRTVAAIQQCQAYGFTDQNMTAICAMQIVENEAQERRARLRRVGAAIADGLDAQSRSYAAQAAASQPSPSISCRTIHLGGGMTRTNCR